MSLWEWSGVRVAAAWVLWIVLVIGGALATAVVYVLRHQPPAGAGHSAGPTIVGPQYSLRFDGRPVLAVILGPPALLTAVWLWQRWRHRLPAT